MPSITLDRMWLNLLATGDAVAAYSDDRASDFSRPVEVRHYAGGRQRSIAIVGEAGSFSFSLLEVSWSTVERLRSWAGLPVQARDNRGRLFVGTWSQVTPTDMPHRADVYRVALSMRLVTVEDGV